jgi:hypothetical protein
VPRPLLEIWRDLNRDRDREPSSLLRQTIAKLEREMASPQYQARMKLNRAMEPKPLSLVAQATVRIGREMSSPEARRRQQLLKACGVAERVLGKPAPVQPTQPDETEKPKRKRASGAGRHPMLKQGISIRASISRATIPRCHGNSCAGRCVKRASMPATLR